LAWIAGDQIYTPAVYDCRQVLPYASGCQTLDDGIFEGTAVDSTGTAQLVGWAAVARSSGYGGPVTVLVGVDTEGTVNGVEVVEQSETLSFYRRVRDSGYLDTYLERHVTAPLQLGNDVEAVTRATQSSRAICNAVRESSHYIAERQLGLDVEHGPVSIPFGMPETVLIVLYAVALSGMLIRFKLKKVLRWISILVSLVFLGFLFSRSLTISHVNALLLGYWPSIRENLIWFLLVGGVLMITLGTGKNLYCTWICPFGAAQECLGAIGGAAVKVPLHIKRRLAWLPLTLAWLAILVGLLMRNPGYPSYEVFGTLFAFEGLTYQWILLIFVVIVSLFIKRPWCGYLCPVGPVVKWVARNHYTVRKYVRLYLRRPAR